MESYGPDVAAPIGICMFVALLLVSLIIFALSIIVACKIVSKTGFHGALGLLLFLPLVNYVMLLVLAFAEWPIQRELEAYKRAQQTPPPPQTPPSV